MKKSQIAASLALGVSLLGASAISSLMAMAADTPNHNIFQVSEVAAPLLIAEADKGKGAKCGAGACGSKASKTTKGKTKAAGHKCGSHKCGSKSKKGAEHKCGSHKCGSKGAAKAPTKAAPADKSSK